MRHASRCNKRNCTEIYKCEQTRMLWVHIVTCNDGNECSYPDCVGSKYVLSKYAHYVRSSHHSHSPKTEAEKSTSSRKRSSSGNIRDFGTDNEAANILYHMVSPKNSDADTNSETSCASDSDEEAAMVLLGFSTPKNENEEKKTMVLDGFKRAKLDSTLII